MDTLKPLERAAQLTLEWQGIHNWEERYQKLIEMGKNLKPLSEELKTEDNKVRGCQSQVWMVSRLEHGKLILEGDSDALLVRGLVALVLKIYSHAEPAEILKTPPDFVKTLGFESHLTPSRTNGLYSMIKRVILAAYQAGSPPQKS